MLHCGKADFRTRTLLMTDLRHSVADRLQPDDDRLFAPAAARNGPAILDALRPHLPAKGHALEIASGTGEHVIRLAGATPDIIWHPSDIEPDRLKSISAWTMQSGLTNIEPPRIYDAASKPWDGSPMDVVFLSNLLHLISKEAAKTIVLNVAQALLPGGTVAMYGPFLRGTTFASKGDERFDAAIRAENPSSGYKDIGWIEALLSEQGLTKRDTIAMPANNLMTVWQR